MMEINRRALYNLLRMNWLNDSSIAVESWQVENYRESALKDLFSQLDLLGVILDENSFIAYAEEVESPEELTELLIDESQTDEADHDHIYLLLFELWRRFFPEKLCLSVFCDELDHQIFQYDTGEKENEEAMQDVIANLQVILDENIDEGAKPAEVFACISHGCANDLESFLYDFIAMQVDDGNEIYASELVEGFSPYLKGSRWFELLEIRLQAFTDEDLAAEKLNKLVLKAVKEEDLSYNLETLSLIAHIGDEKEFIKMVKKTVPLLRKEQEFEDLLNICSDYYRYLDQDKKEEAIQSLLDQRRKTITKAVIEKDDPGLPELLKIVGR